METNLTGFYKDVGSIPEPGDPTTPCSVGGGSSIAISCSIGCRHSSDPVLLWLLQRPGAVAPIQPLAWELPYAEALALKKKKKKKKILKTSDKKTLNVLKNQ